MFLEQSPRALKDGQRQSLKDINQLHSVNQVLWGSEFPLIKLFNIDIGEGYTR